MSVKAVCVVTQVTIDSAHPLFFNATVSWVGLVGNNAAGVVGVTDLDPVGAGGTITDQIQTKMKEFLVGSNQVPMGPSDFVLLIPR
jgi:hypothetical protein